MTTIPFTKMVGAGNDFLVVDTCRHPRPSLAARWPAVSRALCDRQQGVGADGLLVLERSQTADVRMRVFNPDGSEAKMCGNGARCVARYLGKRRAAIETRAGLVSAKVQGSRVAIRMTDPTDLRLGVGLQVDGQRLQASCVNTGVPHAVVAVRDLDGIDVNRLGRALRRHPAFAPHGTNVDFVQPAARRPGRIRLRTYERGVEAETLACGTGVAASAVIQAMRTGRARRHRVEVETRSGDLMTVSLTLAQNGRSLRVTDLVLEGSARRIFDGTVSWPS